jgi:hypothetical protein
MANNNRRRKWVIGLVGLSAMAAAVVPKNVWEALLMEGSSSHSVKLQRDSNGQLAATSPQGPPGSYKPLLPAPPTSSAPPGEAIVPTVGVVPIGQDVIGRWKVTVTNRNLPKYWSRGTLTVTPLLQMDYHCQQQSTWDRASLTWSGPPSTCAPQSPSWPNEKLTQLAPGIYQISESGITYKVVVQGDTLKIDSVYIDQYQVTSSFAGTRVLP